MSSLDLFEQLGGEAGCKALAKAFYTRVQLDSRLRPLFPGKTLRCASEEFSAFLIQFFGGDERQTQYRWWLSLRESHGRFKISEVQRLAWIEQMQEALNAEISNPEARAALQEFFINASLYIVGQETDSPLTGELGDCWRRQLALDQLILEVKNGRDEEALRLAQKEVLRKSVFVGILAEMMAAQRKPLTDFVLASIRNDKDLATHPFNGRTLLHFAAGAGCLPVVRLLLEISVDPDVLDSGGHTPLYRVANPRTLDEGAAIVQELVKAGASIDHSGGVTKSTALHQAARHGNRPVAEALLAAGANRLARDKKGFTPLDRARNCRRSDVAELLASRS